MRQIRLKKSGMREESREIEGNFRPSLTPGDPNIFASDREADAELRQTRRNDRSFPFVRLAFKETTIPSLRQRVTNCRRQVPLIRQTAKDTLLNLQLAAFRFESFLNECLKIGGTKKRGGKNCERKVRETSSTDVCLSNYTDRLHYTCL